MASSLIRYWRFCRPKRWRATSTHFMGRAPCGLARAPSPLKIPLTMLYFRSIVRSARGLGFLNWLPYKRTSSSFLPSPRRFRVSLLPLSKIISLSSSLNAMLPSTLLLWNACYSLMDWWLCDEHGSAVVCILYYVRAEVSVGVALLFTVSFIFKDCRPKVLIQMVVNQVL